MNDPTPSTERREHQRAILSTIPEPRPLRVLSTKMVLPEEGEGANTYAGANSQRVELYRTNWSDALAHPVILVKQRRSERYEIVDGRHRWIARKGKPFMFHALVFYDLDRAQEQALFWYFNTERRQPGWDEKHQAGLFAGDPVAQVIDDVLVLHGLRSKVRAIGTLQRIVNRSENLAAGRAALEFAIRATTDCFPTETERYSSVLLSGFARFYQLYGNEELLVYDEFVARVKSAGFNATQMKTKAIADARTSGQGAEHKIVERLVWAWNRPSGGWKLSAR